MTYIPLKLTRRQPTCDLYAVVRKSTFHYGPPVDESTLAEVFGLAVRKIRMEQGMSQEQLAGAAGLDRTYVSGLERGRRNPTLTTQERLAAALNTPLSELVAVAEGLR